jgi:hypothetical protein
MGWPAESDPHTIFADYYEAAEDGLVNEETVCDRVRWLTFRGHS